MRICPVIFKEPDDFNSGRKGESYSLLEVISELCRRTYEGASGIVKPLGSLLGGVLTDRVKLAQKRFPSEEEVMMILRDRNPLARLELAWNNTISRETLRLLMRDPDRTVSAVARRRLIKATDEELRMPQL